MLTVNSSRGHHLVFRYPPVLTEDDLDQPKQFPLPIGVETPPLAYVEHGATPQPLPLNAAAAPMDSARPISAETRPLSSAALLASSTSLAPSSAHTNAHPHSTTATQSRSRLADASQNSSSQSLLLANTSASSSSSADLQVAAARVRLLQYDVVGITTLILVGDTGRSVAIDNDAGPE